MKSDYAYCTDEDTCIHRRGCRRWIGNYTDDEVKELYTKSRFVDEVDSAYCMDSIPYPFDAFDRFRNSDRRLDV